LKTLVSSLNRGINRTIALDHYRSLAAEESDKCFRQWASKPEIKIFEEASRFAHRVIVRCLMGQDFCDYHIDELYDLLHHMEDDIGNPLNFLLPDWVPHPPARRLNKARDRVAEIFRVRLNERERNPEKWANSQDYISYTLNDQMTTHLKEYYPAHHTLLMFAAHTSTVASIAWTVLEVPQPPSHEAYICSLAN
jgi:sterol 14alpha-demethylase